MNVIISNKYSAMLQTLNIDIIKNLNGEFTVDDIISQFQNFYFQRMILDITAIKNYTDIRNLQKLSISLNMEKVILVLDDSADSSSEVYLSKIISMGIYNFTKNIEGVMYLYSNPNTYRDVAQYHQLDSLTPVQPQTPVQSSNMAAMPVQESFNTSTRIIGIKNVTKQAGATTLSFILRNQLSKNCSVVAIEVDKTDFSYFKDPKLLSTTDAEINVLISKNVDKDVILIDVNNSSAAINACHDVIYLLEPSTIRLNRLLLVEPKKFIDLQSKKVVLNKSCLSSKDLMDFEYEAKIKVFANIPQLDEREKNIPMLDTFLSKLGLNRNN